MTFAQQPLQTFLDELASAEPAPGGGSVAALGGALGASLVAMVCRLTIGKKGYAAVSAELQTILPRAEAIRRELTDLMQADTDAYACVMDAYKLPKETDVEKAARHRAIQDALKHASDVPLRVAELCAQTLQLAQIVSAKGNQNAASDGSVGALMAEAGLRGAAFNVSINLGAIDDAGFVNDRRAKVRQVIAVVDQLKRDRLSTPEGKM